ncbi:hypothetical protein FDECE_11382 [Fusarium decemcellulare]|nr:hypothetical protein FDECE_11382 [Fusarium decemcellulare]
MWNATGPDSNRNAPPGVVPDYDNPEDVYWTLNVVMMAICVSFVAGFFFVRVYVKCTINRKLLTEDYRNNHVLRDRLYEYVFHCALQFHTDDPKWPELSSNVSQWFYASTVVYCPAAFFTKTTILLLMARVFAVERRVSKGIRIFIGFLLVAYLPVECLRIVNCYPIRTYWDPTVANAHCLNQRKMFFSSLSLSILTDVLILLIPIPLTWKLRMPMRKKIKIVLLLGAGGVATALTIYRVTKAVQFLDSDDITVDYTPIDILTYVVFSTLETLQSNSLSALEISIGFVCACLPSLNLLIEHQIRKRRREQHNPRWPRQIKAEMSTVKRHFRWISSSTDPSAPHAPSRPSTAHPTGDRMIDLDVELAMLTGQPVRIRQDRWGSADSIACRPLDHRLNSGDGRREGWLSQHDSSDECQNTEFIMKMVESSKIRAEEGDQRSWCPVWDGPRDPLASQRSWQASIRTR